MNFINQTICLAAKKSYQYLAGMFDSVRENTFNLIEESFVLLQVSFFALYGFANAQTLPAVNQLPTGGVVVRGTATISQTVNSQAASMTVNQASQRAVVNWNSFNLGSSSSINFVQPNSQSVILNRVIDNNISQIYGRITANGQVFLTNANGVYFAPGSSVDVGALTATTHSISNDNFMSGNYVFNRNGSTGKIINEGSINASLSGYVALLAPEVQNTGVVVARTGTVAMAAGEIITLQIDGMGSLASIATTPSAIATLVENKQVVQAPDGLIILSAVALNKLQAGVIKNSGSLEANSLVSKGGKIFLEADEISLTSGSKIEAKGSAGGGTVLIGGDWQGSGDLRQATKVKMEAGAIIDASATDKGDGGKVVLWSDVHNQNSSTQANGIIKAEAGLNSGNGGQIETSGHNLNVDNIQVSTKASKGDAGKWLLDPYDVVINDGTTAADTLSGGVYTPSDNSSNGNVSTIKRTDIQAALALGSVEVSTTGAGTQTGNITLSNTVGLTWSTANTLKLSAAGGISGGGSFSMTGAGTLIFNQEGNSTYSGVIGGISTATVVKQGNGRLVLTGASTYAGDLNIQAGTWSVNATGGAAGGFGGASTTAHINVSSGATAEINAGNIATNGYSKIFVLNGYGVGGTAGALTHTDASNVLINSFVLTLGSDSSIVVPSGAGTLGASFNSTPVSGLYNLTLINNNSGINSISAVINTASVTKQGSGTFILRGANTYSGGTTVSSGTLQAGSATAFGTGSISVSNGAALDLNAQTMTSTGGLTLNGTGINGGGALLNSGSGSSTYAGLVTLGSASSIVGGTASNSIINLTNTGIITGGFGLTLGGASNSTISSIIGTGAGTLTKEGSGSWALNGANTYSGATSVNAGILTANNSAALGSITSDTTIASGARLNIGSGITLLAENITLNGGIIGSTGISLLPGNIIINSNSFFNNTGTLTLSGNISGSGGFTKDTTSNAQNPLILSGDNSFSGPIVVNSGTLKLGSVTGLGNSSGITVKTGSVGGSATGTLDLNGFSVSSSIPIVVQGNGGLVSGALTNTGTNSVTYAGLVSVDSAGGSIGSNGSNSGSLTLSNTGNITAVSGTPTLSFYGNGVVNSVISSNLNLYRATTGTWVFLRDNTYTGTTTLAGGITQIGDGTGSASLPAGDISLSGTTKLVYNVPNNTVLTNTISLGSGMTLSNIGYGSVLDLSNAIVSFPAGGSFTFSAGVNSSLSTPSVAAIILPANPKLSALNVDTTGYQSVFNTVKPITWAGTATAGPTVIRLNGVNVTSGANNVGGILTSHTSDLSFSAGALWSLTKGGTTFFTSSTDSAGIALTAAASINIAPGAAVTESGLITGTFPLTINGGGTLTLSNTNTYSGATTVSAGTLKAGSATAFGTGSISVSNGAALDLNGQTMTSTGGLTLNGTGINGGGALLNSGSSSSTYAGLVTLGSASSIVGGTGLINLTNTSTITGGFGLTLGGAVGGSISSIIGTGAGTLTKEGSGTWKLGGANTFTGTVSINAGTLRAANNTALGTVAGGVAVASGATLELGASSGDITIGAEALSVSDGGAIHNVAGNNSYSGAMTLSGNAAITIDAGTSLNYTGTVGAVSSGKRLSFNTNGNLTFTADLTGGTNATYFKTGNGTLSLGSGTTLPTVTGIYIGLYDASGTYSNTYGTIPNLTAGFFTDSAGLNLNNTVAATGTAIWSGISSTTSNNVGTYSVSYGSGLTLNNSSLFTYLGPVTRSWSVNKANLMVTANSVTKTYDGQAYSGGNGATYTGLANNDSSFALGGALSLSGSSQGAINTGTYVITPSGYTSNNYNISYTDGSLLINQRPVVLTGSMNFSGIASINTSDTSSSLSANNRVGSDNLVVTGTATLSSANSGTRSITNFSGLSLNNSNYTFSGASGSVNVIGTSSINVAALNNNDVSTLIGGQLAGLTSQQLGTLSSAQLSVFSAQQLASLSASQLSGLSSLQMSSLNGDQLKGITPAQVGLLSTTQLSGLVPSQLAVMSLAQLKALTPTQLSVLTADQINGLSITQISTLTGNTSAPLTFAQMSMLTPVQMVAVNPVQIAQLSASDIASLSNAQLQSLLPAQLAAIAPNNLKALSPTQIKNMSTEQVRSLSIDQLSILTPAQITGLSIAQLAGLDSAQLAAIGIFPTPTANLATANAAVGAALSQDKSIEITTASKAITSSNNVSSSETAVIVTPVLKPEIESVTTNAATQSTGNNSSISKNSFNSSIDVSSVKPSTGVLSVTVLGDSGVRSNVTGVAFEQDSGTIALRTTTAPSTAVTPPSTNSIVFSDKLTTFMMVSANGEMVEFKGGLVNNRLVIVAASESAKRVARSEMVQVMAAAVTSLGSENRVMMANLEGVVLDMR